MDITQTFYDNMASQYDKLYLIEKILFPDSSDCREEPWFIILMMN